MQHKEDTFQEGRTVILTLKDSGVLDNDNDTLENVNIIEEEKVWCTEEEKVWCTEEGMVCGALRRGWCVVH